MRPFGTRVKYAGCPLVVWVLLLPITACGAWVPEIAGTLPEDYLPSLRPILESARQRSPQAIAAQIEIALSEARVDTADAPRLPSLGATFNLASNQTAVPGDNRTQTRDTGFFYNVTLNQALFHWGALKNQGAIAAINVQIARKNYDEAYRLLAVNLRGLFLSLVAKKAALLQARHALGLGEAGLALEQEKLQRGLAARNQVAARELGLREFRLHVAQLEADFAGDRQRLARIAGLDELADETVPAEIPKPGYSAGLAATVVTGLRRDGAKGTIEAQILDLRIQEAARRYEIEKVRLRPKVFASAGAGLENATTATANSVTQQGVTRQTVSVNAQWYLFDGHATRGAKREAITTRRLRERQLAVVTAETIERAGILERQLALDAEALEIGEMQRGLAAEALGHARRELALGNLPANALNQAESGLRQREAAVAGARAALLSRWSELVSLAGLDPVLPSPTSRHARQPG